MAVKLNDAGYAFARQLIQDGRFVDDPGRAWRQHRPSREAEDAFVEAHGYAAYGRWHLAINDAHGEETKARYEFPYGDFDKVHRCGLIAAERRADQFRHLDIASAASFLLAMVNNRSRDRSSPS